MTGSRRLKRLFAGLLAAALAAPAAALAADIRPPAQKIEVGRIAGRWYEVARLPNKIQKDCQGGTSDWSRTSTGYSVIQTCHRGSLANAPTQWKAQAKIIDPMTDGRIRLTYFGGPEGGLAVVCNRIGLGGHGRFIAQNQAWAYVA